MKYIPIGLLVIAIAIIAGTFLAFAQEQKVDDRIIETPDEQRVRMLRAFDDPSGYRAGAVIVNFAPGTSKDVAGAVLERLGFTMETETVCGPEEAEPEGPTNATNGCRTTDKWFEGISAAVVAVPAGEERAYAERLIAEPEVIWVEPDLIATIAGEEPLVEGQRKVGRIGKELAPYLAIGAIVVLALAFLLRRKKPTV